MFDSYRDFLRGVLRRRQETNSEYSQRAFARDIGLSASRLSEILNKGHALSLKTASTIASRLGLGFADSRHFQDLVILEISDNELQVALARRRVEIVRQRSDLNVLEEGDFLPISNWYHFAVLELIRVEGLGSDIDQIAKKLGIYPKQVVSTLTKLEQLGIITFEDDQIVRIHEANRVSSPIPSKAIRSYHKQILNKAYDAIEGQSIEQRSLAALTIAVNKKDLERIKKLLEELRAKFRQEVNAMSVDHDEVYCLATQFFNLGHPSSSTEERAQGH